MIKDNYRYNLHPQRHWIHTTWLDIRCLLNGLSVTVRGSFSNEL